VIYAENSQAVHDPFATNLGELSTRLLPFLWWEKVAFHGDIMSDALRSS
jgi:hypothetical protein